MMSVLLADSAVPSASSETTAAPIMPQTAMTGNTSCEQTELLFKAPFSPPLRNPSETEQFFTNRCRRFESLAWFDSSLTFSAQGAELLKAILTSSFEGLNPKRYHQNSIIESLSRLQTGNLNDRDGQSAALRRLDILLTDAYVTLAKDLYWGITDWDRMLRTADGQGLKFESDRPKKEDLNVSAYLSENLERKRISRSLERLSPDYEEYSRLKGALQYYRTIQMLGGWNPIPEGKTIRPGDTDARLPLILKRLAATRDISPLSDENATRYIGPTMIEAVRSFQKRHNLTPDGVIGPKTLKALNVPVNEKIRTVLLNLERFRWMPRGLDSSEGYIDVNIPSFRLTLKEQGYELLSMKTIVGRPERPTPVLSGKIAYAVLNPSWTAPETIVREDILGKSDLREYLSTHDMRVYAVRNGRTVEINPDTVDWKRYAGKKRVPFTFIADAGEANPLGGVKFIFPNKYTVYLHDTNTPELFNKENRTFSSGCVRVSDPQGLLDYLMQSDEIVLHSDATVNGESDKILNLKKRIPVIFRYMTVGVDTRQRASFYEDIYGYDDLLFSIIKEEISPGS